jgi:hypothetical protein
LGDAAAVKGLIARAVAVPDAIPGFAEQPFYARSDERAVVLLIELIERGGTDHPREG